MAILNFFVCQFILISILYFLLKFLWREWRHSRKPKKSTQFTDTIANRVAIHEAGHAVLAWNCTSVTRIMEVNTLSSTPQRKKTNAPFAALNGGHVSCQ